MSVSLIDADKHFIVDHLTDVPPTEAALEVDMTITLWVIKNEGVDGVQHPLRLVPDRMHESGPGAVQCKGYLFGRACVPSTVSL